jgi:ribosomal protein L31
MYAQKVVLSDGSTFTAYTTAPTPQIIRLTRDVSNNPLWAPGTDKRGLGDGIEEGRVGRFRRRFGGSDVEEGNDLDGERGIDGEATSEDAPVKRQQAFGTGDFDWMSEGATEEKIVSKDAGAKGKATGKRK